MVGLLLRVLSLLWATVARAEELKLGYLYIQSSSSWVVESFTQFKLAVQDINADAGILPGDTLSYVVRNSGGNEPQALEGAVELVDQEGVVGVVGTGYSSALGFPAGFCSLRQVPIVSPGSTLIDLSDKSRYPYLLRSVASDALELKATVALVGDLGWRAASFVHTSGWVGGLNAVVRPAMDSRGIQYLALPIKSPNDADFDDSVSLALGLISKSGYRVTIMYVETDSVPLVASAAGNFGLRGDKFSWVLTLGTYTMHQSSWDGTPDAVFAFDAPPLASNPVFDTFKTRWPSVSTLYNESVHGAYNDSTGEPFFSAANIASNTVWDTDYAPVGDGLPDVWGSLVYDAVWLYARAIQAVKDAGGQATNGAALREKLLEQNFLGISGQVQFDQATQDRKKELQITMKGPLGPTVVGTVMPLLSEGSPSDAGWCQSGCTSLNSTAVAGLPWPSGARPSDGSAVDASASALFLGSQTFVAGEAVAFNIQLRDSFNFIPCKEECGADSSTPLCGTCSDEMVDFGKLALGFRKASDNGTATSYVGQRTLAMDYNTGTLAVELPGGVQVGPANEDQDVAMTASWGGESIGGIYSFTVQTVACPVGHAGTQGSCQKCNPGEFAAEPGSTSCKLCPAGTKQEQLGGTSCDSCAAGYFQSESGATECAVCPRGTYATENGASECRPCELDLPGSTTELLGALSVERCICPEGTFWSRSSEASGARCEACPSGLACAAGKSPPLQAEGFQAGPQAYEGAVPSPRVRCASDENCPGGRELGVCSGEREGLACDKCPVGYSDDGQGKCVSCGDGSSILPILVLLLLGVGFLVLAGVYATRKLSVQSHALMSVALSGSLFITAFQTLAAFHQLKVEWIEPMRSLRGIMSLLMFDVDILNLECVFMSNSPEIKYLCSLMIYPGFALALLVIMGTMGLLHERFGVRRPVSRFQVWNAEGNIIMIIYPSLAMMALMPMRCAPNPDGSLSLLAERSILCWDSDDAHIMMVTLSVAAILAYIVFFISYVAWVVWKYPKMIAQGGASFVRQYEFFFKRFRADRYYYCLIFVSRNMLLALIPVIFVDEVALQVLTMSVLLIMVLVAVCYLTPWRTGMVNLLDAVIAVCLLTILSTGALLADIEAGSLMTTMQAIMVTLMVGIFGTALVVVLYNLRQFLYPPKKYGAFLSHHKGAAQLLARWFKQRMGDRTSDSIFLDSDNLDELFSLLHTVAFETKNLVVLLTGDTLSRLWCACEVVAASNHGVNIVLVSCDGTQMPADEYISELEGAWTEAQTAEFADLGIEVPQISEAYRNLRSKPMLAISEKQGLTSAIVDQVCQECKDLRGLRGAARESGTGLDHAEVLIMGNTADLETACCCQVVQRLLAVATQQAVQIGTEAGLEKQLSNAKSLVVVLRRGILSDSCFAAAVTHATRYQMATIPLLADSAFKFPDEAFWADLEGGRVLADLGHPMLKEETLSDVTSAYKIFFKIIAIKFTEHGSEAIQAAEVTEVKRRLKRSKSSSVTQTASITGNQRETSLTTSLSEAGALDNEAAMAPAINV